MMNRIDPALLAQWMTDYLSCPCRYFPPQRDDSEVMAAWQEARARGAREGFTPVIVVVTEVLWETLLMNACDEEEDEDDPGCFDPEEVAEYRKRMLEKDSTGAEETLAAYLKFCPGDVRQWVAAPAPAALPEGTPRTAFWSHKNFATGELQPLLLAEIPTGKAWEVFAYLPFGGWNSCPDTPALMAVSRRWREKYGAVPAVVGQDTLEYILPAPAGPEAAWELAKEHCIFCPDALDTDAEEPLKKLAAELAGATVWSFWWD